MLRAKYNIQALGLICGLVLGGQVKAQSTLASAWIVNHQAASQANESLRAILPEVQSVTTQQRFREIRSAGISLYFLGPLQSPVDNIERKRALRFLIPPVPVAETHDHISVRPDVVGTFVNGVPIYKQFTSSSDQNQNLWHFDPIANSDDGSFVATGRPRPTLEHKSSWGLIENLFADSSKHSPIIGYAFDGFPIYGPWASTNPDARGALKKMRSSYQLRKINRRIEFADGTRLTPSQYGPEINGNFPLGTFVEDYEFVSGSGDLDEFNGRFVKTPEYPDGTYAYFLSSDASGHLAFPYLLAGKYFGKISQQELSQGFTDSLDQTSKPATNGTMLFSRTNAGRQPLTLEVEGEKLVAGIPMRLSFQVQNSAQQPLRFLEYVHERPLHLLIVSDDLSEFVHIHPELAAGDRYEVFHTFKSGGRYRLYADFTPPGGAQRVESFDLTLLGKKRENVKLSADKNWGHETNGLTVAMTTKQSLRAGEDIELAFTIRDKASGKIPENLTPYLGAWAHFVIIDESLENFIHAHPLENQNTFRTLNTIHFHNEKLSALEPPPSEIRTMTSFQKPGLYKLWAQFQVGDSVIVQPFVLQVNAAEKTNLAKISIPDDAVEIKIGANGFTPSRLEISVKKITKIALTREATPNCANKIIFPSLGISQDLKPGQTVIIEIPPQPIGELRFQYGMGMYKGAIVVH